MKKKSEDSQVWLSEEFLESNDFKIGQASLVLLLINYIASEETQLRKENYGNCLS